jgi:mannitol-1-phosphate 5-dehydrogenase
MKAWVDRKLFIHNLGHATTAYLGFLYNPKFIYLYEALSVTEILNTVRETMLEAAVVLLDLYPNEFSNESLIEHIDDLLYRFQNKALGDTIYRVGCDLKRKLSAEDRLAGAIHSALEKELPYNKILYSLICGCHFKALNENGYKLNEDIEFEELYKKGLNIVLTQICCFDEIKYKELFKSASIIDKTILNLKIKT